MSTIENNSLFSDLAGNALERGDIFLAHEIEELREIKRRLNEELFLSVRQIDFLEQVRCRLLNNPGETQ
jgi:hypothetical protein